MTRPYLVLINGARLYDRHVTEHFARKQVKELIKKGIKATYAYKLQEVK